MRTCARACWHPTELWKPPKGTATSRILNLSAIGAAVPEIYIEMTLHVRTCLLTPHPSCANHL